MSKQIELRKVCKGERFILDPVEFVKLDDDATADTLTTAPTKDEKSIRDYSDTELIKELSRRRNRCYSVCENMGFAIFGCCNADGKPSEFCKTQCKYYVDMKKEGSNAET